MTEAHKELLKEYRKLYQPLKDHVKNLMEICKDRSRIVDRDFLMMYEEELLSFEKVDLMMEREFERIDRDVSRERRNIRCHNLGHEREEDGETCGDEIRGCRKDCRQGELQGSPDQSYGEHKEREVIKPSYGNLFRR